MIETKILSNVTKFADKYKSIYTGCIHYKSEQEETRDVIPITENILYAISLVTTFSLEKAEAGFAFLERLFKFYTKDGFPGGVHEFPNVYSDRPNVEICLALTFFLKNHSKVVPKAQKLMIETIRSNLLSILSQRSLKPVDNYIYQTCLLNEGRGKIEISTFAEYEKVILCKLLMGEKVTLPWHKTLDVYTGPLLGTYYRAQNPLSSLFSQLIHMEGDNNQCLFAALLPKTGWQELLAFEKMEVESVFINHQGSFLSVHFDRHSLIAQGNFDVKLDGDRIDITLDPFEEIDFFLTDCGWNSISIDGVAATAFYPEDKVILTTENRTLVICFHCNHHRFFGHIMKGNRPNQIVDVSGDFTLFDYRIHLKIILNTI